MHHNRTGEDKMNCRSAFRLRRGLLLVLGHADIVPKVELAFFHVDEIAEFGKKAVEIGAIKGSRGTIVEV